MNRTESLERHSQPDSDLSPGAARPDAMYSGRRLLKLVKHLVARDDFDPDQFVIAGSARLLLAGTRKRLSDLDIVARGSTWVEAQRLADRGFGHRANGSISGDEVVRLYDGRIEVCDRWFMHNSDTDRLIENAEVHDGLRFFSVDQVVEYKSYLNRPKDRKDLAKLVRDREDPKSRLVDHSLSWIRLKFMSASRKASTQCSP